MTSICAPCRLRLLSRSLHRAVISKRRYSQSLQNILDGPLAGDTNTYTKEARSEHRGKSPPFSHTSNTPDSSARRAAPYSVQQSAPVLPRQRHAGIKECVDSHEMDKAWETYFSLHKEMQQRSEVSVVEKKARKSERDALLLDTVRNWLRCLQSDTTEIHTPSITSIWTGLRNERDKHADALAARTAAALAMRHVLVSQQDRDVFGTAVRRRSLEELLDFWYLWVNKYSDKADVAPSERDYRFLPPNWTIDTTAPLVQPIFALNRHVPRQRGILQLALCLQYVLERGLKNSMYAHHFVKYKPFLEDLDKIWSTSKWDETTLKQFNYELSYHAPGSVQSLNYWLTPKLGRAGTPAETVPGKAPIEMSPSGQGNASVEPSLSDQGKARMGLSVEAGNMSEGHLKGRTKQSDGDRGPKPTENSIESLADSINVSVGRFVERENLKHVETLWADTAERLDALTDKEIQDPAIERIYNQFLYAFRSLRRARAAVDVWNHMIQSGVKPTRKTWNVMLKGCHIGREVDQMEEIWKRMIRSGCQPDEVSWATRIHGLFKFDRVTTAFAALAELDSKFKASLRGRGDTPSVKPDIGILNNALSGAQHLGPELTGRILAWGHSYGIEPDITTYNTLINASLHSGSRTQARKIMARMAAKNIPPDGATFVILLHAMFEDGFLAGLSPEEQEKQALAFIASLEADGIAMEERGYALLLDHLLKTHANMPAASAVLAHLAARGMTPTPHMYTIVMTFYFDRDPPNIPAVMALWERLQASKRYVVDVIMYDRMVEGFARADELGKMMQMLKRMVQEGKRPGWLALMEALKCLVRHGDRDRAAELVRDVAKKEGNVSYGVRGRKGHDEFWNLVAEFGLLH